MTYETRVLSAGAVKTRVEERRFRPLFGAEAYTMAAAVGVEAGRKQPAQSPLHPPVRALMQERRPPHFIRSFHAPSPLAEAVYYWRLIVVRPRDAARCHELQEHGAIRLAMYR